jgi:hypothetical protein
LTVGCYSTRVVWYGRGQAAAVGRTYWLRRQSTVLRVSTTCDVITVQCHPTVWHQMNGEAARALMPPVVMWTTAKQHFSSDAAARPQPGWSATGTVAGRNWQPRWSATATVGHLVIVNVPARAVGRGTNRALGLAQIGARAGCFALRADDGSPDALIVMVVAGPRVQWPMRSILGSG